MHLQLAVHNDINLHRFRSMSCAALKVKFGKRANQTLATCKTALGVCQTASAVCKTALAVCMTDLAWCRRKLERTVTSDYTTAESSTLDDFQCQICLGTLRDCVVLEPCGHNWCATCLSNHFASLLQVWQLLSAPVKVNCRYCNCFKYIPDACCDGCRQDWRKSPCCFQVKGV